MTFQAYADVVAALQSRRRAQLALKSLLDVERPCEAHEKLTF